MANVLILHGDDLNALRAATDKIISDVRATGLADFNLTVLDGKEISKDAYETAVLAAPFMVDQRVVIFHNPLALAGGRDGNKKFLELLAEIPPSTLLYLVLPDSIEKKDWAALGKTNFLRKWVEKNPDKGSIISHQLPAVREMPGWIMKRAAALGGQFAGPAAAALTAAVGNDTQLAENEIRKLLLYVDYSRPVDADDVNELVTGSTSVSIFDMVDFLATGKSKDALRTLHRLEEDSDPLALFPLIIRQFRLLVQTRDILDRGGNSAAVQQELSVMPFVAEKTCRQAQLFTAPKLKAIYHKLLELDHSLKTSMADDKTAMDLLVLDVAEIIRQK